MIKKENSSTNQWKWTQALFNEISDLADQVLKKSETLSFSTENANLNVPSRDGSNESYFSVPIATQHDPDEEYDNGDIVSRSTKSKYLFSEYPVVLSTPVGALVDAGGTKKLPEVRGGRHLSIFPRAIQLPASVLTQLRVNLGVPMGGADQLDISFEKARNICFVAGGIGISPVLSLLDAICLRINAARVKFLHSLELYDTQLQRRMLVDSGSWLFKKVHVFWSVREMDLLLLIWGKLQLCKYSGEKKAN